MSDPRVDLAKLAARALQHPAIESAIMGALRDALPSVIEDILREEYGGQTVRTYVAKARSTDRDNKRLQIEADIAAQLPHALIATKHGISERQVRRYAQIKRF